MGRGEASNAFIALNIPLDRVGTPDELGEVTAILCSEAGSCIAGQSLSVDGGCVIH